MEGVGHNVFQKEQLLQPYERPMKSALRLLQESFANWSQRVRSSGSRARFARRFSGLDGHCAKVQMSVAEGASEI